MLTIHFLPVELMLTIHFLPSSIYSFIPSLCTAPTFVSFDYMLQLCLPTQKNQAHVMLLWLNLRLSFNKKIFLESPSPAIFTMGIIIYILTPLSKYLILTQCQYTYQVLSSEPTVQRHHITFLSFIKNYVKQYPAIPYMFPFYTCQVFDDSLGRICADCYITLPCEGHAEALPAAIPSPD